MTHRCGFCNNSVLEFQEKEYNGKVYHPSCIDSVKAKNPDAEAHNEWVRKQQEEFAKQPKVIKSITISERGAGFVIHPITGEKIYKGSRQTDEFYIK